ncbi:thioredoxin domain-containing protein 9-like [Argonauta hians]
MAVDTKNTGDQLMKAVAAIETHLDAEIERLDQMDDDDLAALRRRRVEELKKRRQQEDDWRRLGHGEYEELGSERDFFDACKASRRFVCHFYRDSTARCAIVDKHLKIAAPRHLEARFVKIDVARCPFLVERLRVKVLPAIYASVDSVTACHLRGFDELGGSDDFPTEALLWRLGQAGAVDYQGEPPACLGYGGVGGRTRTNIVNLRGGAGSKGKTVRNTHDDGDDRGDSDDDW